MVLGHLEAGASKHYKNDTPATADRKHRAVTFFLDKVFGRVDRGMSWVEYVIDTVGMHNPEELKGLLRNISV